MRHHKQRILISVFNLLLVLLLSAQETVYIEAGEFGRGILKNRNGECYIIAPRHVITNPEDEIKIIGNGFVEDKATFIRGFESDFCVLKVNNIQRFNCTVWEVKKAFAEILETKFSGYLERRNNNGNVSFIPVSFITKTDKAIIVKPNDGEIPLSKGMSGSSLFTDYNGEKIYLGMLQSVEAENGVIVQADDIERILFDFFNPLKTKEQHTLSPNDDMVLKISKVITNDLNFINKYYTKLIDKNSNRSAENFIEWIKESREFYVELPENYPISTPKRSQFNNTIKSIQTQMKECENIWKNSPDQWNIKVVTNISIMSLNLESLLEILN